MDATMTTKQRQKRDVLRAMDTIMCRMLSHEALLAWMDETRFCCGEEIDAVACDGSREGEERYDRICKLFFMLVGRHGSAGLLVGTPDGAALYGKLSSPWPLSPLAERTAAYPSVETEREWDRLAAAQGKGR